MQYDDHGVFSLREHGTGGEMKDHRTCRLLGCEHPTESTTTRKRRTATAGVTALATMGLIAGCGAQGGSVGFHEFTEATSAQAPELCKTLFGSVESLGRRLDLTLYPSEAGQGMCGYEASTGATVALGIAEETIPGTTLYARGEDYVALLYVVDDAGVSVLDPAKQGGLTTWLEGRANAVSPDLDRWLESLPAAEPDYASADDLTAPWNDLSPKTLDGRLLTPSAEVHVASVERPTYFRTDADGEPLAAGAGRQFLVSGLTITQHEEMEVVPAYSVRVGGKPSGPEVQKALDTIVAGGATALVMTVPEGAADVDLIVTTGEDEQAISLVTGEPDDDGRSTRLERATEGSASGTIEEPSVVAPDGDEASFVQFASPFSRLTAWRLTPWTAEGGWAPEGKTFLTVTLDPQESESVKELTTADASVTVNGNEVPAAAFDPTRYAFDFVVPEGLNRFAVRLETTIDTAQLDREPGWFWEKGSTIKGHLTYDWVVDVNAST